MTHRQTTLPFLKILQWNLFPFSRGFNSRASNQHPTAFRSEWLLIPGTLTVGPDFYMFTVLTYPLLHGASFFLEGTSPTHKETIYVKNTPFASCIQLPFTLLNVRTWERKGRLLSLFILSFQAYPVVMSPSTDSEKLFPY